MFKNIANTGKCILNAYDFKYIDISKRKNTNFLKTESVFWKGSNLSLNCKPVAWKMHLTLQKTAWETKKCHMRQEYLQAIEAISKYKWTNALGFELQSAPNLHRDKKIQSFELQSAPNLHRDKKKVLNFKVRQTCTGTKKTKKTKTLEG